MRRTLVIPSLAGGGAQRVLTALAGAWARRGDAVTVVTLDAAAPSYAMDPAVELVATDLKRAYVRGPAALAQVALRCRRLREVTMATRPDVVLSFLELANTMTALACARGSAPVLVSERNDPHHHPFGGVWGRLRLLAYRRADRVVAQTRHALAYFPQAVRAKGCVIPNPVAAAPPAATARARDAVVTGMGRLVPQKGFDLLVDAFCAADAPGWRLEIWGDGPERDALRARAERSPRARDIALRGPTSDAYGVFRTCGIFVLSSRYEGFPNVLCEAMASGAPVASFACDSGPNEIVRDGIDGRLVPAGDVPAMASAIAQLAGDTNERSRLAARAPDVARRFGEDAILGMWDAAFGAAAETRARRAAR